MLTSLTKIPQAIRARLDAIRHWFRELGEQAPAQKQIADESSAAQAEREPIINLEPELSGAIPARWAQGMAKPKQWTRVNHRKNGSSGSPDIKSPDESPVAMAGAEAVFHKDRQVLYIGEKIASGGEATIHSVLRSEGILVKRFKPRLLKSLEVRAELESKICEMSQHGGLRASASLAWPTYPIYNDCGQFIGFAMPRLSGIPLRTILNNETLRESLPNWSYLEITQVAMELARQLMMLHSKNILVGDLNPNNIMFCPTSFEVRLLDCDSCQFEGKTRKYYCPGFIDEYSAPEVIECKDLSKWQRPVSSEYFSFALLIFALFMRDLHPFASRNAASSIEEMLSGSCPWLDPRSKRTPMGEWNGIWYQLPTPLQAAFLRCFRSPRTKASRLSIAEWYQVLSETRNYYALKNPPPIGRNARN